MWRFQHKVGEGPHQAHSDLLQKVVNGCAAVVVAPSKDCFNPCGDGCRYIGALQVFVEGIEVEFMVPSCRGSRPDKGYIPKMMKLLEAAVHRRIVYVDFADRLIRQDHRYGWDTPARKAMEEIRPVYYHQNGAYYLLRDLARWVPRPPRCARCRRYLYYDVTIGPNATIPWCSRQCRDLARRRLRAEEREQRTGLGAARAALKRVRGYLRAEKERRKNNATTRARKEREERGRAP